ncbi:heme ABC exporter ATP-binding protein CcmA [Marinicella litoralis]|uniref:Heme exporter protein A n=1 Tax=Marinicella litoralis TaxID=644220 RepID=A0A4R6XAZ1_9GAMM|nr:heme ABC exporter ATP-binding protein CcmA [Marinicella litoralis]TDR16326.1 heme exporter protein A [Marinicella litoralis]
MTTALLQINDAQCQRAGDLLFAPVNLAIDKSELAVIAGPNGSGKTTLLEAVAGLSTLSSGQRLYQQSADINLWLQHSHYLGHKLGNKGNLSCQENLEFVAHINETTVNQQQIASVLNSAGLAGYQHQYASDLSAGQKKRLALSRLLLLNKTFWLLDEPFVNLDHAGCDWLYQVIAAHITRGGVVILTAHDQKKIHQLAHHHITLVAAIEEHSA